MGACGPLDIRASILTWRLKGRNEGSRSCRGKVSTDDHQESMSLCQPSVVLCRDFKRGEPLGIRETLFSQTSKDRKGNQRECSMHKCTKTVMVTASVWGREEVPL